MVPHQEATKKRRFQIGLKTQKNCYGTHIRPSDFGRILFGRMDIIICELYPQKVAGIIGIAAAPDFTTQYALNNLSEDKDESLKLLGSFLSILSTRKNL